MANAWESAPVVADAKAAWQSAPVVGDASSTTKKDDLPWDVPVSGAQMRATQEKTQKADETINAIKSTEPDPGLKHLLWSIFGEPAQLAVRGGQSALGERALPTGTEAFFEAGVGVTPSVAPGAGALVAKDAAAVRQWIDKRVEPHPWTPENVEAAARDLGAPTVAKAQRVVEKRINQSSPTSAQQAIDAMNAARDSGKPMMLPDVMQGGVQKLAGRVSRAGGDSGEIMTDALRGRNAGAVERLSGDVNAAFGSEKAYDANQALMDARKTAAKPEYDAAYKHPPINPDEMKPEGAIGQLLERPSVRAGMANARKIAAEEGVDMHTLGIDLDAQGEPILVRVPTWQTLDYMKRGIDQVVEQYRNPITGKLDLDTYGRVADITRTAFVGTMRDLNPSYAKALNAWSGPSRSMDALQVGADALKRSPEQNAARLAEMSANDVEFARLGIGQTLRDIVNKRGPLAAEFDRVAGTQYGSKSTRDQLRPFFQSEDAYKKFVDSVTAETTMARTSNKILGGSQTAERLAEDESSITPGDAAHTAIAGALGHHGALLNRLIGHGQKLWDKQNPELNAQIARLLGATDIRLGRDAKGRVTIIKPDPPQ